MANIKLGSNSLDGDNLKKFMARIDKLEEEKSEISTMLSGVWAEAKALGYDIKVMKAVRKIQKLTHEEREEQKFLQEAYENALGIFS